MSLIELTAAQLRDGLAAGQFSAREITQCFLDQIQRVDGSVGAFLRVVPEQALAQAAESDRRRAAGRSLSGLDGIPVALKDVLCTAGEPTTCSSRMLANFVPPYDATVVRKLRDAGLVLLGKTNMDEFAMGGSTENAALGTTCNPWDLSRVPGGSSGGSAAAVAARMAPLRDRHRHGRVDSPAGGVLRDRRAQADLRSGQPFRAGRLRQQSGPGRADGAHGGRCRAAAGSHRRPRSARCDLRERPGRAIQPRHPRTVGRTDVGCGARAVRSRPGLRGRCGGRARDRHVSCAGRSDPRRLAPAQPLRDCDVLHHRALRSVEQSGPLRRRALRISYR